MEVGRMMAFSPGWLENESIWLHMSYKWYPHPHPHPYKVPSPSP